MIAYGTALVDDDPERFGTVSALGLDEVLFVRVGPWHRQEFSTQIVDVKVGQLLDVVPGRSGRRTHRVARESGRAVAGHRSATPRSTCRVPIGRCSTHMVPDAIQVADPFHVVSSPTPSSTSAAGGSRTRRWDTEATRPIRSIGADAFSPRPKNA